MAIPSTGTTWRGSGVDTVDNRFNQRGGLAAVLIRDNRGAATNISPWAAGAPPTRFWSPFALDGQLRDDLLAVIRVDGEWVTNPDPNEGFLLVGAMTEDGGPERAPNISEDNQMILQSNQPFDTDLTEEGIVINFTGVETLKPSMKRLRMNLPLTDASGNLIVEDAGAEHFVIGKTVDVESVERQIILLFSRKKGGKTVYTAEAYSLCKLTNIGSFRRSKTDPDAGELGFTVLPDPYLVTKDPSNPSSDDLVPVLFVEWVAGDGWAAIGGNPVWPAPAPIATQTGTTTATVSAANPTGGGDPFAVTWEKSVAPHTTWTAATVGSVTADTPGAGFTTYNITGLVTATAYKFRGTAEGSNGLTALTAVSNTITTA
jgi:hypothetical protein